MPWGAFSGERQKPSQFRRGNDPGAAAWFAEPNFALLHQEIVDLKQSPLWNPYTGFGVPLAANMQSQPFNPLAVIGWLSPSPKCLDLFVILRLFVAGLLAYLFFALLLEPSAALLGAAAYMLSGYFILYLNMPEISVAAYLPGMFWAVELLIRKRGGRQIVLAAIFMGLVVLGGMPEVSFLAGVLVTLYFIARLFPMNISGRLKVRLCALFAISALLGVFLSMPQTLPFLEYVGESFNAHSDATVATPGMEFCPNMMLHAVNYVSPFIYGPIGNASVHDSLLYTGFSGYWGAVPSFLALLAVAKTFTVLFPLRPLLARWRWLHKHTDHTKPTRNCCESELGAEPEPDPPSRVKPLQWNDHGSEHGATIFFFLAWLFLLSKRFGLPPAQWLGYLPVFKLIVYWKYAEPFLAFCVAAMAALGMYWLATGGLSARITRTCAIVLSCSYLVAICGNAPFVHWRYYWIIAVATTGLIFVAWVLAHIVGTRQHLYSKLAPGLVALVALELLLNFPVENFYMSNVLPLNAQNPFQAAPFVSTLSHLAAKDHTRIIGFDSLLYPNWASAFQLFDVRHADAIYPKRYLPFVRNFANGDPSAPSALVEDNLTTRFAGTEYGTDPLLIPEDANEIILSAASSVDKRGDLVRSDRAARIKRFWQLSSIRYLLALRDHFLGSPTPLTLQILESNKSRMSPMFKLTTMSCGGKEKFALFLHPEPTKSAVATVSLVPPSDRPCLHLAVGMADESLLRGATDGVIFSVEVNDLSGRKKESGQQLFSQEFKPLNAGGKAVWMEHNLDLSRWAGHQVQLVLRVAPGKNNADDWASWADLAWVSSAAETVGVQAAEQLPQIYAGEARIYTLPETLPRAALFSDVRFALPDQILKQLREPAIDPFQTVFVEKDEVNREQDDNQSPSTPSKPSRCEAQSIVEYTPMYVRISCDAKETGLLMLTDTYYPGWSATVDGNSTAVFRANYLFRGVVVPRGKHTVEFRYQPMSYKLGLACFALALLAFSLLWCFPKLARERDIVA